MCGICGFSSVNALSDPFQVLDVGVKSLSHRGPDGRGVYFDSNHNIGLAHTRLSILDLSEQGKQPMVVKKEKDIVLSFNGEIYNFIELKKELVNSGVGFSGTSDTEVLIQLYCNSKNPQDFVENVVPRLRGIFAFVIWDGICETGLIVRDRFGVKPLYYGLDGKNLIFASELKCLINMAKFSAVLPGFQPGVVKDHQYLISNQICCRSVQEHLTFLWNPSSETVRKNVKKLDPGCWMMFGPRVEVEIGHWNTEFSLFGSLAVPSVVTEPPKFYIKEVKKLLRQSVHSQMVSDVKVGAFLSGGLDSSSVVAFAREICPNIECFTVRGDGFSSESFSDDYPYAKFVADRLNVRLNDVCVTPQEFFDDLTTLVTTLEEPTADPAALNVLYIARSAKKNGISVLLSGTGGDDIFSGYRRHLAIQYNHFFEKIPKVLRSKGLTFANYLGVNGGIGRRLKKFMSGILLSGNEYLINSFKWNADLELEGLYSKEFSEICSNYIPGEDIRIFLEQFNPDQSSLKKCLSLERRFFLADHNLIYTDKMSMASGVEVRVPFLDERLVNFSYDIPDSMLIKGMTTKWILKKAMEPYLPKEVIYRPKTGFGLPIRGWIKNELNDVVNDILSERNLRLRGLFDPVSVKEMIKANRDGKVDASYTILSLVCIELWCQQFVDC